MKWFCLFGALWFLLMIAASKNPSDELAAIFLIGTIVCGGLGYIIHKLKL